MRIVKQIGDGVPTLPDNLLFASSIESVSPNAAQRIPLTEQELSELGPVAIRGINNHSPVHSLFRAQTQACQFLEFSIRRNVLPSSEDNQSALSQVKQFRDQWVKLADPNSAPVISRQELMNLYVDYGRAALSLLKVLDNELQGKVLEADDLLTLSIKGFREVQCICFDQVGLLSQSVTCQSMLASEFLRDTKVVINRLPQSYTNLVVENSFASVDVEVGLNVRLVQRAIGECWQNTENARKAKENTGGGFSHANLYVSIVRENEGFAILLQDDAGGFENSKYLEPSAKHPDSPYPRQACLDLNESSKGGGVGLTELFYTMRAHGGWVEVISPNQGGTLIKLHFPSTTTASENS